MSVDSAKLVKWFQQRHIWLQTAAHRVFAQGHLTTQDIRELIEICRMESSATKDGPTAPTLSAAVFTQTVGTNSLRLTSISDVKGIEALAPRSPLAFADEAVTIVYGLNGVGKSGYIRILNNVCGSKNRRKLLGNVFVGPSDQGCTIGYSVDGKPRQLAWKPTLGEHPELASLEIYDTECGQVYITAENEVAYEPWLLAAFQQLIDACELVDKSFEAEIAQLPSAKPVFPAEYTTTKAAQWYGKISAVTSVAEVDDWCGWTAEQQAGLDSLNARLLEKNSADQARSLRNRKATLEKLVSDLRDWSGGLDDSSITALLEAEKTAREKRKAASEDAASVFAGAPLQGVGQQSWKLLWEQARAYSEGVAYPARPFPVNAPDAHCVLCQQPLSPEAQVRLTSFESFVKGELERLAADAEAAGQRLRDALPQIPTDATLDERLNTLGLGDKNTADRYRIYRADLDARRNAANNCTNATQLPALPADTLVPELTVIVQDLETQALAFDSDTRNADKSEIKSASREAEARKWLSGQKLAVEVEVARTQKIAALNSARDLTSTTGMSGKKAELSKQLVSDAFIERFKAELKALSADRLKIEMVQTRTTKGHVYHQLKLIGAKLAAPMSEVLSEGERRIVSLAAFLADVGGIETNSPFVFDDPISSLDQEYEEWVVARLALLAQKRQLIVFTHRLSLLTLLEEELETAGISHRVTALQREPWGAGEPGDTPFPARKPKAAINFLLDATAKAAKVRNASGTADYEIHAKAICRDTRIMLERLVEDTLLNGIVLRFRRSVQTDNRIGNLGKIQSSDCKLIEDMMTKYSRYEHSQSKEAPVALPPPDEITSDLLKLQQWHKEFTERPVP